jgi:hypothetical protein
MVLLLSFAAVSLWHTPARSEADKDARLLRHVVLFKFKKDADEGKVQEVVKAFGKLPDQIDQIHQYEWGKNNSPEQRSKGFTHCFLVTFKSQEDLDAYLPHPAHQEFVKLIGPVIEDVLVVDYWTGESANL